MALLEIDQLSVTYPARGWRGRPAPVLNAVSLQVDAGETVALVGESGSGKSTLGNAVLGIVRATGGTVRFDGQDITSAPAPQRRALSQEIQAVFQDPYSSFNPHRTVGQTVSETLTMAGDISRDDVASRVASMLERVGLDGSAASRFPSQFSGGQRQRIAIARALLPSPRLVVCDEAVSALDLSVQAQILNLLNDLQRDLGVAYLFITHDMWLVQNFSHRVAVLRKGELVESGDTSEVTQTPQNEYTRALLDAAPVANPTEQRIRRAARRAMNELPQVIGAPTVALTQAIEERAAYEAASTGPHAWIEPIVQMLTSAPSSGTDWVTLASAVRIGLREGRGGVAGATADRYAQVVHDQEASRTDVIGARQSFAELIAAIKHDDAGGAVAAVARYHRGLDADLTARQAVLQGAHGP